VNPEIERERRRMIETPFSPMEQGMSHTLKAEHAMEYSAFYLGEISTRLGEISASLKILIDRLPPR
jgi:hypothetical protein